MATSSAATTLAEIRTERDAQRQDQPLELLREFLEDKKHHAPEKKDRDEAWMMLILLDSFECEHGIVAYINERMTQCEMHGLISKNRCFDCQDFDTWLNTYAWQECSYCKFNEGFGSE